MIKLNDIMRAKAAAPAPVPTAEGAGGLQHYSREALRRSNSVAQLEHDLAHAKGLVTRAAVDVENAEEELVAGRIGAPEMELLMKAHSEGEARIQLLSLQLRTERRLLDKAQNTLKIMQDIHEREQLSNVGRQCAEIIAPIIDAVIEAAARASTIAGIGPQLERWVAAQGNRSTNTLSACMFVAVAMRQMLSGPGDAAFLADWIGDLQNAAPELVSDAMVTFQAQRIRQLNDRFERRHKEQARAAAPSQHAEDFGTRDHLDRKFART